MKFILLLLQYGVECFCSNKLRKYPKKKEEECNKPCPGNKKQKCGGTWRISVYKTGMQLDIDIIKSLESRTI